MRVYGLPQNDSVHDSNSFLGGGVVSLQYNIQHNNTSLKTSVQNPLLTLLILLCSKFWTNGE